MPLNRLASRFVSRAWRLRLYRLLLFAVAVFFCAVSLLFRSPRRLLSSVDYLYVIIHSKRFRDILNGFYCFYKNTCRPVHISGQVTIDIKIAE